MEKPPKYIINDYTNTNITVIQRFTEKITLTQNGKIKSQNECSHNAS